MRKRYSEVKTFTEAKHKVWGFKVEIIKVSMFAARWMFETDKGTFTEWELVDFS